MSCICPEEYTDINEECVKITSVTPIQCPPNCNTVILDDGNAICRCTDIVELLSEPVKVPIPFDNTNYFKEVSWTLSYKPTEGGWNSYFTFHPNYSVPHNGFFQTGYNSSSSTLWTHPLNNNSFCVFQGVYYPWVIEFPVANTAGNKILNSVTFDIEARRYLNQYDDVVYPQIGVTDMYIYNSKNNSGYLTLTPQKTITDLKKYPKTEGDKQNIITTFEDGKQRVNYFYNRVLNEKSGIPMFTRDENNIFKEISNKVVKFSGKKVLERMVGDNFIVHLSNTKDSRFNITIRHLISDETLKG
jgi:hypothetical protein